MTTALGATNIDATIAARVITLNFMLLRILVANTNKIYIFYCTFDECSRIQSVSLVNLSNGEPLIKGKKVTGFSWPEEIIAKRDDAVPFNLEEELKKIGADYSKADKPFEVHVIEDGRLITGQNPGSTRAVAEAVIKRLKTKC
jgi:putative intracellular protease/amidase